MKKYILLILITLIVLFLVIFVVKCRMAIRKKTEQLTTYHAESVQLSYGDMTYVDQGEGEVILSVHGIFGGYDQAFETCRNLVSDYRIVAPSRFGYLGSDICGEGTPKEQAAAYAELLDKLGIEKVFVLATSAGGSVAIRFALDFPERTKGLILYCSAMPPSGRPENQPSYAGPPAFMVNDYAMYLISPFFEPIMGMDSSTIYDMFPISERKAGVILDSSVTNLDMARNVDSYAVEELKMPTLILHAKDDKLADFAEVENAVHRFPDCRTLFFETGGHLMKGHETEVRNTVMEFIATYGKVL